MKQNLFIVLMLVAGFLLIYPLSVLAAGEAEGKTVVETPREKKGIVPQSPPSNEQREKQDPKGLRSQDQQSAPPVNTPVYQPPLRGTPGGRVGGGTRGIGDELTTLFVLAVLAPNHIGLTVQGQPTLYWYLSKPTSLQIELTIIEDQAISPLLEKQINAPIQPGIHRIRLADYGVSLLLGKQYRWFMAAVPAADRRSKDIIAGGIIELVESSEALRVKLSQTDKRNIPYIYAESGIWYDTITAISDLIEANPNDMNLHKQRAALLEQVGLSEVAQYEMKQSGANR
jgi:hypothetical protein